MASMDEVNIFFIDAMMVLGWGDFFGLPFQGALVTSVVAGVVESIKL